MFLPLALLLSAVILSIQGSVIKDSKDDLARDVFPGIGEYYFNGLPGTWNDAYLQCKLSGGHIAIIDSAAEADALKQMMIKFKTDSIHLGFHDQFAEGEYVNLKDQPIDSACKPSVQWAVGYPKGGASLNCGGFTADGMMDTDCAVKQKFICELNDSQDVETPIDDGYELIKDMGVYKLHNTPVTWPVAWQTCKEEGAHLVVINSEAEVEALNGKYNQIGYFVGAHRFYGSEDFVTVFDVPLEKSGYNTWYYNAGPAGDSKTHPYLSLSHNGPSFTGLWTAPSSYSSNFICEK